MSCDFGKEFEKEHEKAKIVCANLAHLFALLQSPVSRKSIVDLLRNEAERIENQINEEGDATSETTPTQGGENGEES